MRVRRRWLLAAGVAVFCCLVACGRLSAEEVVGGAAGPCEPVAAGGDGVPDLQEALQLGCRSILGETGRGGPLASRLRILAGGWADASYLDNDLAGRGPSFDLDHTNLHLDIRLDDRLQVFGEAEYEHGRDLTGLRDERDFELEQGYVDYAFSDALSLRAGKFATPFGYWTPVHWSVNVDTIEAPIYERTRMVPEQQLGGRVHGRLFPPFAKALEPMLEYSLVAGYGAHRLETGKPKGLDGSADLRLWSGDLHFVGVSWYAQQNSEQGDRDEQNLMLYGQLTLPADLLLRTEYLHQWRSPRPGFTRDADVVYAKLRWTFHPRAYLNYRFEFGQDDRYGFTADHVAHTFTLGFRPVRRVIAKLETAYHDYDEGIGSYVSWGASLGVVF